MNYKIITDPVGLTKFIDWLPELEEGECYYLSLFARKKYHESAKNDKSQCKRVTATSKEWLIKKINQLEIKVNAYTNKDGTPVHNDALALYVTVNPRSFKRAQVILIKKLAEALGDTNQLMNPASLAMSSIQKAKSRTVYVDFDFDDVLYPDYKSYINSVINEDAYTVIVTRGGFHLLVNPEKIEEQYRKTWYQEIASFTCCDVTGDNLIPVAGCTQGGYTPYLTQ